jgi:FKBP-type peptidyl-prolyl cis-trans isomerase SlyD
MVIAENKVVLVHYTLTEGSATGEAIESTLGGEPLGFIFGVGSMIPDFEKNLEGKKAGDAFSFGIKAADAYGEHDDTAVVDIQKSAFGIDEKTASEIFIIGEVLPLQDHEGNPMDGLVRDVTETTVTIDFNHPMAGVDLYFTGHIDSVRDASSEELEHGHVHGAGGHHH